jgi:hypothetical protein
VIPATKISCAASACRGKGHQPSNISNAPFLSDSTPLARPLAAQPTGYTISAWHDPEFDAEWRQHIAVQRPLHIGQRYTRKEVYEALNVPEQQRGGDWATGYHRHNGNWYLFANIGLLGRTGHDYENRWIGNELLWRGKTGSRLEHESIESMLADDANVHVFTRTDDLSLDKMLCGCEINSLRDFLRQAFCYEFEPCSICCRFVLVS